MYMWSTQNNKADISEHDGNGNMGCSYGIMYFKIPTSCMQCKLEFYMLDECYSKG